MTITSSIHHLTPFHPIHFFFKLTAPHRDLHSFPTRRSSDLGMPPRTTRRAAIRSSAPPSPARTGAGATSTRSPSGSRRVDRRSEEHTSELQSHVNLVCRLLLEKKKK